MEKIAKFSGAIPIIAWSLLCAAAMIGASLANKYVGVPDLALWVLPVWWVGFTLCLVRCK